MTIANEDQDKHWNSEESSHWVDQQDQYDEMLGPFLSMILEAAALTPSDAVLDVGCGCGATTIAAARIAREGHAIGADLSAPMLEVGRARAAEAGLANVRFERVDAQVHDFPDDAFDAVISRFGVMFFADPPAAFDNMRRATRPDGRLAFVCWQPLSANDWFRIPATTMAENVPTPPEAMPGAVPGPGPFALSKPEVVGTILDAAGWREATIEPRETTILLGGRGDLERAVGFVRTGRSGKTILGGLDEAAQRRALDAVREALSSYVTDEGVRMPAAVWVVTARA